jgi:hypothetical protein
MRLVNARLCLDCEDVHDQQHCPMCGSESFAFMTRWVTPSDTMVAEANSRSAATRPPDAVDRRDQREQVERRQQIARREQVDAYRQMLNPTQAPRRGKLVARGAMGLALLGVARMIWRAAPEPKPESAPAPDTALRPRFGSDPRSK